ncbi:DUF3169 family protein [Bengtsoniella intestinalis]|uniref:DUF3169 family protein n=1 Tax=Bengtsoniella intestinalis TaxID=3073143 RepID=UPI00391F5226
MNNTKKSVLKTIAITVVAGIIGCIFATAGHTAAAFMDAPLPLGFFAHGFEYVMYAIVAVQVALAVHFRIVAGKVKAEGYSDEENSTYARTERRLGALGSLGTTLAVGMIPIFFAIMVYCGIYSVGVFISFFAITFINLCNEVGLVRLCGKVNPKQDVDWSKLTFNADLYQKMDEREKEQMGQIGAKLVTSFHIIFVIAFLAVAFLNPVLDLSGYELVVIGVLWAVFSLFIGVQKYRIG